MMYALLLALLALIDSGRALVALLIGFPVGSGGVLPIGSGHVFPIGSGRVLSHPPYRLRSCP